MRIDKISELYINYNDNILRINGEEIKFPIVVRFLDPHECERAKLLNDEKHKIGDTIPEIIVDASKLNEQLKEQELKQWVRDFVEYTLESKKDNQECTNVNSKASDGECH